MRDIPSQPHVARDPAPAIIDAPPAAAGEIRHGKWTIAFDPPPIPVRDLDWSFHHEDYDASWEGEEDGWVSNGLGGRGVSVEDCKAQIADIEEDRDMAPTPLAELPVGWQAAQAARCPCRGSDDYCLCINEYNPARYGLAETEKCEDCGLLASDLLHRLCERPNCAVREHLTAKALTGQSAAMQHGNSGMDTK